MAEQQTAQQFSFEEARKQLVERMREHIAKGHTRYAIARKSGVPRPSIDRALAGSHADIMDQFDRISKAIAED